MSSRKPTTPSAEPAVAPQHFDRSRAILALTFGVLGPPIFWIIRLMASYILVPYACWTGWIVMLQAVTFVTLLGTAAAGYVAWTSWRQAGHTRETAAADVFTRSRFLAIAGVLSAAFFFAVIAAEGIANFIIHPCL